jgi:hypothetical protein
MSVCGAFRLQFRRTWQLPSNAHAYRLYVFNELLTSNNLQIKQLFRLFAKPAVISEALYSTTLFALFLESLKDFSRNLALTLARKANSLYANPNFSLVRLAKPDILYRLSHF